MLKNLLKKNINNSRSGLYLKETTIDVMNFRPNSLHE